MTQWSPTDQADDHHNEHDRAVGTAEGIDAAQQLVAGPDDERAGSDDRQRGPDRTVQIEDRVDQRCDEPDDQRRVGCLPDRDLAGLAIAEQPIRHDAGAYGPFTLRTHAEIAWRCNVNARMAAWDC